ncbi:ribonuclease H-like domain-containing protein [Patescibacteria group bacterium]|nr:3'-5' exonuclease [Candidatus Falkowbacteria bacterium]MBU3905571.1 ribonuclease H-like domain-containing protein [Patescibacteria group bacterium]MBU4015684.1 ribonuclease H-like domain-containing protein [Patescibacteria group bacterium]MBU4026256.1 ribonuclease H-like domain-containing protein [Patescibacteria group bacterium]MBU4073087.1 ribonuclease H-like domain-containing protein [Patescibacteria group bacterium]
MSLVFDIETIGSDFDSLDEVTRHNLTRWIKRHAGDNEKSYNAMLKDLKEGLGFSPLTGEIVALGVLDTEMNKGAVYFSAPGESIADFEKGGFLFKQKTEPEMLESFWQGAKKYNEFVSFNGRCFDVPFLAIRSAAHKIRPSKDLMSRRYLSGQSFNAKHIDLLDQLSFYGAVRRKGSLHLYCSAFNIKSPKAEGITGDDVGRLFKEGKYKEIAEYNSWDLIATRELYDVWKKYINLGNF